MSVVSLSFYLMLVSSILFLAYERPWESLGQLKSSQWKKIIIFSAINTAVVLLWNTGVKYIGPLGAILMTDYAFETYPILLFNLSRGNLFGNDVGRATLMLILGYVLVPLLGGSVTLGSTFTATQLFLFGGAALFVHNVLVYFKGTMLARWQSNITGVGKNKLFAISMTISTATLLVLRLLEYSSLPAYSTISQSPSIYQMVQLAFVSVFAIFFNYHIEAVFEQQLGFLIYSKASLTSSFVFALVAALFVGFSAFFAPALVVSFLLIITAIHILFSKSPILDTQGIIGRGVVSGISSSSSYGSIASDVIRQILEKPTSRRIFTFLIVNLMFMFVEMTYGIWTNSLGLITDACHMLFDATALFIALFAEVISAWKPNDSYSYGYGRVQILSGFVNGIFLIFISITILMESIESVIPLIKTTAKTLLQCTPEFITHDMNSIITAVTNIEGVIKYTDFHYWGHSEEINVGTIKLFIDQNANERKVRKAATKLFKDYKVTTPTIEISRSL
eukprot:gene9152-10737_t